MSVDVIQAGIVFVKYTGDVAQLKSFRLLSNKSGEWKGRLIELAMSGASCSLHVYKLKPGNKRIPYFEIQITARSILTTSNQEYQYHFAFDHEPQAAFYVTDESVRSEWFRVISNCILKLRVLEAQTDRTLDRTSIPFSNPVETDFPDDVSEESVDVLSATASFSALANGKTSAAAATAANSSISLPAAPISPSVLKTSGGSGSGSNGSPKGSVTFSLPGSFSLAAAPPSTTITSAAGDKGSYTSTSNTAPATVEPLHRQSALNSSFAPSLGDISRSVSLNRGKSTALDAARTVGESEPVRRSLKAFEQAPYDGEQSRFRSDSGNTAMPETQTASLFLNRSEFDEPKSRLHISELLSPIGFGGSSSLNSPAPHTATATATGGGAAATHRYIPMTLSVDAHTTSTTASSTTTAGGGDAHLKSGGLSPVLDNRKGSFATSTAPLLSAQLRAASTSAATLSGAAAGGGVTAGSFYASNTPYSDLRRSQTTTAGFAGTTSAAAAPSAGGVSSGFGPAGDFYNNNKPLTSVLSAQQSQLHSSLLVQQEALKSQVHSLTAMNDELNEALEVSEDNRRTERENYAKQITQLHVSLRESESARNQYCEQVKQLQSELEEKQSEIETSREDLTVAKDIQRTQSNLLSDYLSKIESLNETIETFKQQDSQRAALSEIMSAVKSEVTELKAVLAVREMEAAKWKFECEAALTSLKESESEIAARDKLIKEVLAAKEDLLLTKDATQLELNAANNRVNELLVQLDQQSNHQLKEVELRESVVTLERDILRCQVELNAYRVSEESYKLSTTRLESLIKEQQAFIDDMTRQLISAGELKKVNAELLNQLNDVRVEQMQQANDHEKTLKQLAEVKQKLTQSEEACVSVKSEWDQDSAALQSEIAALNGRLKQAAVDESVLNAEIAVLQRHIETNKEQYLQLESEFYDLQRHNQLENQSFNKQKATLQEAVESSNKTVRELQHRCKVLEETQQLENADSKQQIHDLEGIIADLRRGNKELTAKTYSLEDQVNKLTFSLSNEKSSHTAVREQLQAVENQRNYELLNHQNIVKELQDSIEGHVRAQKELKHQLQESELFRRDGSEKHVVAYREITQSLSISETTNKQLREDLSAMSDARQQERKAAEERISALMTQNESVQLKILEVERQLSTLITESTLEIQRLTASESELVTQVRKLTSANEALERVLSEEHEANNVNKQTIAQLRSESVTLSEEKSTLFKDLVHYRESCSQLDEELNQLMRDANQDKSELEYSIAALKDELAQTKRITGERIVKLEETTATLTSEKYQTELTLKDTTRKLEVTLNQLTDAKLAVDDLTNKRQTLQVDFVNLQTQLDVSNATVRKLNEDLNTGSEARAELALQLKNSGVEVTRLNEEKKSLAGEIDKLNACIDALNRDLLSRGHEMATVEAKLVQSNRQSAKQLEDIGVLKNDLAAQKNIITDLEALEEQLKQRIAFLEEQKVVQLESEIKQLKNKLKEMKGYVQATSDSFKEITSTKDGEITALTARIRKSEENEAALRQTISTMTHRMSEMVLLSESNQQVEHVRTTLNSELLSVYEEHHKMQAKCESLTERLATVEKANHKCVSRLRNLLASLSSYIEGRDVSYEYKKSIGLVQTAVAYKDKNLDETVMSVEEHVGRLLRDFNSLRSAGVELQLQLLREQQQFQDGDSEPSAEEVELSSVGDLIKDNKRLLDLLIYSQRDDVSRLNKQLQDELALKSFRETLISDLNSRIATYEEQVKVLKQGKIAAEQRHSNEINLLQQDLNRYMEQSEHAQEEHLRNLQSLAKTHEQKMDRQSQTLAQQIDARVAEERAAFQAVNEKLNLQFAQTESILKNEIERVRSDLRQAQEQVKELGHSNTLKDQEIQNFKIRYEVLQNDVNDKVMQLETCLAQLEKAELKAAKESRERLDLERTVRRFKSTAGPMSAVSSAVDVSSASVGASRVTTSTAAHTSAVNYHSEHRAASESVNRDVSHSGHHSASAAAPSVAGASRLSLNDFVSRYDGKQSHSSSSVLNRHSEDTSAAAERNHRTNGHTSPERPGNNFHVKDFMESKRSRAMNNSELNVSTTSNSVMHRSYVSEVDDRAGMRSSASAVAAESTSARIDAIMKSKGWKVNK